MQLHEKSLHYHRLTKLLVYHTLRRQYELSNNHCQNFEPLNFGQRLPDISFLMFLCNHSHSHTNMASSNDCTVARLTTSSGGIGKIILKLHVASPEKYCQCIRSFTTCDIKKERESEA